MFIHCHISVQLKTTVLCILIFHIISTAFISFYESIGLEECVELREPDDVIPVEELDTNPETVVFDDIRLDSKSLNPIKEYFSASRHKNVTAIYLAQSYYDVPKYIRRNTGCIVLMRGLHQRDVREIAADHADGITKEQLAAAYHEATEKKYGYFVIDRTAEEVAIRYRKRLETMHTCSCPASWLSNVLITL